MGDYTTAIIAMVGWPCADCSCCFRSDAPERSANHRREPQLIVGLFTELLIAVTELGIALLVAVSLPVAESPN